MGKKICWLLALMCVMCSCQGGTPVAAGGCEVPCFVQVLAWVGVICVLVFIFGFILVMGGNPRNE